MPHELAGNVDHRHARRADFTRAIVEIGIAFGWHAMIVSDWSPSRQVGRRTSSGTLMLIHPVERRLAVVILGTSGRATNHRPAGFGGLATLGREGIGDFGDGFPGARSRQAISVEVHRWTADDLLQGRVAETLRSAHREAGRPAA